MHARTVVREVRRCVREGGRQQQISAIPEPWALRAISITAIEEAGPKSEAQICDNPTGYDRIDPLRNLGSFGPSDFVFCSVYLVIFGLEQQVGNVVPVWLSEVSA
jgi:hypothetical protein